MFVLFAVLAAACAAFGFAVAPNPALPAGGGWELLGSKKVNYSLDHDVLHVGKHEGSFKKLKITVTGGSLNMHKMVVEYGNGDKDEIELRHNFGKGSNSRLIDLKGGDRYIKDITFWYDTDNRSNKKATLHVYGR
ncbi:DUF2541 domain-containing protein [Sphingobacteriales bacterium UPWRP_1]|nr:hypothetical protein B6N25_04375 [Sphingobacteriales bacterium TSM_CSS]PSJ73493.1 DUF2541 domain-containing protein [Sphingobacteriales bacterium UPWRP_1]